MLSLGDGLILGYIRKSVDILSHHSFMYLFNQQIVIECLHQHDRGHPIYDNSYKSNNNYEICGICPYLWETVFKWSIFNHDHCFVCLPSFCLFLFWNWWHKLICKESVFLSKQSTVYIQLNCIYREKREEKMERRQGHYIIIHQMSPNTHFYIT